MVVIFLIIIWYLLIPKSILSESITYDEITVDLKDDIAYYFEEIGNNFTPGNLVRFGFHSCVTGCDGCLNLENPSSAGLEPSWNALLSLYTDTSLPSNITWSTKVNIADFWTICSTLANMIAIPNGSYVPDFKFWIGRTQCSTSPNQTILASFPDPILGFESQTQFFESVFNLTASQYVALIGGHTLGFAHSEASGFDTLSWTATPTILDNEFYYDLINKPWYDQEADTNGLYKWIGKDNFFMFNSDMCIYKVLDDLNTTNGESSCDYYSCSIRKDTLAQIEGYAFNNTLWLDDYAVAWNIMMLAQSDVDALTQILP